MHADSTFRVHETFKLRVRSDVSATRVAFEIMSEPVSRRNRRNGRYETLGLNTELTVLIGADRNSFLDESSGEKRGKEKEEEGKKRRKKGAELKITFAPFPLGSKDDRRQGRRTSRIPSQVEEDTHRRCSRDARHGINPRFHFPPFVLIPLPPLLQLNFRIIF